MQITRITIVAAALALAACSSEDAPVAGTPGDPLPGLSAQELERFRQGRALFDHGFTPEEGLGPLFNQDRCSSCHDLPASGGTGAEPVLFATRFEPPDRCDPLREEGGNNIQRRATPLLRAHGIDAERSPPSATAQALVHPPSLFGLGLVEAIPDSVLLANADPEDADGDGISGRTGRTDDGRLGRFGRKAEFATLREFIDGAIRFEMGITTPDHPTEERVGGMPLPPGSDPTPDPEIDAVGLDRLTDFVRLLAPLAPAPPASAAERETQRRGEREFHEVGCDRCHVPMFRTGPHAQPALGGRSVRLYSDLLLHDLGPELTSICGANAGPSEFRTAALVGLRHRTGFLHDGRAASVWGAVALHGGEAGASRAAFMRLPEAAQAAVIAFLNSR